MNNEKTFDNIQYKIRTFNKYIILNLTTKLAFTCIPCIVQYFIFYLSMLKLVVLMDFRLISASGFCKLSLHMQPV